MLTLENGQLFLEILDPVADKERMGVRYCTGGYIYQITDRQQGALLSGPTYPNHFNWFDGQGIPDAFNLSPLRLPESTDSHSLIIGVGLCDLSQQQVIQFCDWKKLAHGPDTLSLQTQQHFQDYALQLERTVSLLGRTVRSWNRLSNNGKAFIPMRWFPHPFYPQPTDGELLRVNIPVSMAENAAYHMLPNGFISRKQPASEQGAYQVLEHQAQATLSLTQRHPLLGLVGATCSYVPDHFPIWGNCHTFSWEPFLERMIAPGQSLQWWIDYDW